MRRASFGVPRTPETAVSFQQASFSFWHFARRSRRQIEGFPLGPPPEWLPAFRAVGQADGLCEEMAPAIFTLLDDGRAHVKEGDDVKSQPGGAAGLATVPAELEDAVAEAAEECSRVHLHWVTIQTGTRPGTRDL
jgi:ferredoxin